MLLRCYGTYPADWADIAARIKQNADWNCERCGSHHDPDNNCQMTVHHLDGNKSNSQDYNLASLCRRCHLKMHHLFCPEQLRMFPAPTWLQKHIDASPWKCTG